MTKRYLTLIPLFLLALLFVSILKFPTVAPVVGISLIFMSLAISISSIFEKHKGVDYSRAKIIKDILALIITFILILFFGGLTGLFANAFVSSRFGVTVGVFAAMIVSFGVGYLIKKVVDKAKEFPLRKSQ